MDVIKSFEVLISENEFWLTKKVINYCRESDLLKLTATSEEAWRQSVYGISASILAQYKVSEEIPELRTKENNHIDDIARFGIEEAVKHRNRGIDLSLFFCAIKFYRQAYLDLINEKGEPQSRDHWSRFIIRCFDKIEIGILTEWDKTQDQELVKQLKVTNRSITNDKNKYLTIFKSNPNPILLFDKENNVDNINHAAAKIFQGPELNQLIKEIEKFTISGKNADMLEMEIKNSSDSSYFEIYLTQIQDVSEKFKGTIALLIDITERKKFEQQMSRLSNLNLIGEMAAGIGHEIRNPLTVIRGFLQLFSNKIENSVDSSYIKIMIDEIDRANSIISQFLSLAKNKHIKLIENNLNDLIEKIYPLINAEAIFQEKNIQLDLAKQLPYLLIDEKEIVQLILNLVRNGLEASSRSGTVIIKTDKLKETVILSVIDTGEGIPKEVMDKIGTPFISSKPGGTGLGLPICYSIAARHKAALDFKTGSKGTCFEVQFRVD